MNYFSHREENKIRAVEHTAEMYRNFRTQIRQCIDNSFIFVNNINFIPTFIPIPSENKSNIKVEIVNMTTTDAIRYYSDNSNHIAVLNFASYKNPGGMFIEGSSAQEESLCHQSFLYNVLSDDKFVSYYSYNQRNLKKGIYEDRAIYSPKVVFTYPDKNVPVDVLTCAAPNASVMIRYNNFTREENSIALSRRISFVTDIFASYTPDVLILGAYGCGVFKQNPYEVAHDFVDNLFKFPFTHVVFAIPAIDENNDPNFMAFKTIIQ